MIIEFLPWDSRFFGLKIGRCFLPLNVDHTKVFEVFESSGYDLVYLNTERRVRGGNLLKGDYDLRLVDRKATFSRSLDDDFFSMSTNVSECFEVSDKLISLAYVAGKYSRFKSDDRFKPDAFQRLYREWIEKSIRREIADAVFVAIEKGEEVGMITVAIRGDCGSIGLIAVDGGFQGKGIGRKLVQTAFSYIQQHLADRVVVDTQMANKGAVAFYEQLGFRTKSMINVYHLWKKQ